MDKKQERLEVIKNIKKAISLNQLNSKVEIGDHVVTEADREAKIYNYDIEKKNPINKIKAEIARHIANKLTNKINVDTKIVGLENIKDIKGGAIITSNHFNPVDNTVIRLLTNKLKKHLEIVIQESNVFMNGFLGFLMNNCYTIPLSDSKEYMKFKFYPSIEKFLKRKDFILIYPEQEMWFNYKKPRPPKIGAFHMAAKYNVPIIPVFIEIRNIDGYDENGFQKVKYILHILKPIYPDINKQLKDNKDEMQKLDYEMKVKAYENIYGKKLTYDFNPEEDIAGYTK